MTLFTPVRYRQHFEFEVDAGDRDHALVGNVVPVSFLFALASRTAFSISRWAMTRSLLKNLRTLVLRVS
jgi:hypothetical protein